MTFWLPLFLLLSTSATMFTSRPRTNDNLNHSSPAPSTSSRSRSQSQNATSARTTTQPTSPLISNPLRWLRPHHPQQPRPLIFSPWSSPSIPDSGWACEDFMVGVGMVIIQPSTQKMVILYDHSKPGCFFLPRGRKDVGETLQEAALREAYEESGYEIEFLPLYKIHKQPIPPAERELALKPDTEPIYMTARKWGPRNRRGRLVDTGGEYFVSWFIGQIPDNPVHHKGVGMPDEQGFESFLIPFDEVVNCINPQEKPVVQYALHVYRQHLQFEDVARRAEAAAAQVEERQAELTEGVDSIADTG
ncbi:hypothetical protein EV361DRAFT_912082 [Lentinula raphanica]